MLVCVRPLQVTDDTRTAQSGGKNSTVGDVRRKERKGGNSW